MSNATAQTQPNPNVIVHSGEAVTMHIIVTPDENGDHWHYASADGEPMAEPFLINFNTTNSHRSEKMVFNFTMVTGWFFCGFALKESISNPLSNCDIDIKLLAGGNVVQVTFANDHLDSINRPHLALYHYFSFYLSGNKKGSAIIHRSDPSVGVKTGGD